MIWELYTDGKVAGKTALWAMLLEGINLSAVFVTA